VIEPLVNETFLSNLMMGAAPYAEGFETAKSLPHISNADTLFSA